MNISKLRNKAEGLVTQLTAKDECERRTLEAISNKSYAAHPTVLNEIAEDTFSHDRYAAVMRLVWKTVESPARNWRAIAKALILVDHLIKNGAEKVVGDVQMHIHDINALTEFRYMEGNLDRGSGVREKASSLLHLLNNPDRIRAERLKARDLKAQYSGYGSGALSRSTSARPRPSSSSSGSGSSSALGYAKSTRDFSDKASRGVGSAGSETEEWRAGYSRSPSPTPLEASRVLGRDSAGSSGSDKIDFDAGREFYSSRISRFQEQERREASLSAGGTRARRGSKDSSGSQASDLGPEDDRGHSKGGKGGGASKKRGDRRSFSSRADDKKSSGPDLLSGDDPFPTPARRPAANDFSSFASFAPQVYQGGGPVGGNEGVAHQGSPAQNTSQIVSYGYVESGSQGQQPLLPPPQQQQQQQQQFPGGQAGWGEQGSLGQQQQAMTAQQQQGGGYGQAVGQGMLEYAPQQPQQPMQMQGYVGQSSGQGRPYQQGFQQQLYGRQQQQTLQQQQPMQQPQGSMYTQYQPQQGIQQQQPHQQQLPQQQQAYQPYQEQQLQPYVQATQQHQAQPQLYQPQQQQQQQQDSMPLQTVETQQPLPAPTQTHAPSQLLLPQPSKQQQQHAMNPGGAQVQGSSATDGDWVPTEVVRAGIAGQELVAAVGGLRQTGFKPSDVGGSSSVFTGQGRRGGGSSGPTALHNPTPHPKAPTLPPRTTVEYVEEGQELRADTREFMGARANLNKTGLSGRLQGAPQQPLAQTPQQPLAQTPQQLPAANMHVAVSAPAPRQGMPSSNSATSVSGGGQWQGLPMGGQQRSVGRPGWQVPQGGLRSTGLMERGIVRGGLGVAPGASSLAAGDSSPLGPGGSGGSQGVAPWQQGTAGLRPTGLMGAGEGEDPANGLSMGRLNLN